MAQNTGRIRDFSRPNPVPDTPQEVSGRQIGSQGVTEGVQILTGHTQNAGTGNPGPDPTEINVHPGTSVRLFERTISEEDKMRAVVKKPSDPQVVLRDGDPKVDVSREDGAA